MDIEQNPLANTGYLPVGRVVPIQSSRTGVATHAGPVSGRFTVAPAKQHYVVGFLLYNEGIQGERVMLLEKRTGPVWMRGLLNGVGGKVEPGEAAQHAMQREYAEEAGVEVVGWNYFTTLGGPDWTMDCYYVRGTEQQWFSSRTLTGEPLKPTTVARLVFDTDLKVVPNVPWMVTMALHFEKDAYGPYNITVGESHIDGKKFAGSPTATSMAA